MWKEGQKGVPICKQKTTKLKKMNKKEWKWISKKCMFKGKNGG